ncbi:MAG: MFS transporter [Actinomycetota bacterium]|nr:MFS transporter [Actinomycetota bacterium]
MEETLGGRADRSRFAGTLSGIMAVATFSQFSFGILAGYLLEEFDITRSQLGLLTTAFFIVGGLGSPPAGRFVDNWGGRRVALAAMAIATIGVWAMAAASSFLLILLGAALAGLALASGNPTTNKLVAAHMSPGARGVTMGIKQAGVQVGGFGVGLALPWMAEQIGWRWAMASLGLVSILVFIAIVLVIPADERVEDAPSTANGGPMEAAVWWMTAYALLMGAGVAGISAYLPLYSQEEVGLSVGGAGLLVATMGAVGIASRITLGWVTEHFGHIEVFLLVMAVGSVLGSAMVLLAAPAAPWLLWIAAITFGVSAITWNTVGMIAVLSEVGPRDAGRASGYVQSAFYGGFAASPVVLGYSIDATDDYWIAWLSVALAFGLAAVVAELWRRTR